MSSLYFLGDSSSYLRIPNTDEFNFGTGDFTIEWYQYEMDSNPFPRIFQIGSYSTITSIGVSIESGNFYFWSNGSPNYIGYLDSSTYINTWVHFAISRYSNITKIFMNGTIIASISDSNNYSSSADLVIGNESSVSDNAAFGGYMTYFTWVKGISLYQSNFTVSNNYPTLTSYYRLLLKSTSSTGTLGGDVENNQVYTYDLVPDNFGTSTSSESTDPPSIDLVTTTATSNTTTFPNFRNIGSLFTNNSMVYYKPNSLASCGVGTVRNSSIKSKRI